MNIRILWPAMLSASFVLMNGCKKDEPKKKEETPVKTTTPAETPACDLTTIGCAKTFTGASITPTVPDGDYVGVSFLLGNTTNQTAGDEKSPNTVDNDSVLSLTGKSFAPKSVNLDYLKKIVANRFHSDVTDEDEIWDLIKSYDEAANSQNLVENESLYEMYKREQGKSVLQNESKFLVSLPEVTCPTATTVDLGEFGGVITPTKTEGSGVCLLVKDSLSGNVTNQEILDWSSKIMARYGEIFGDQPNIGAYSKAPWIVVLDATTVPKVGATNLAVFARLPSEANNHPVLIINSAAMNTASRIDSLGTIAHEIYHGISYYYKVKKAGGTLETVAIDEGTAHYFEDIFGNSAKVESSWTLSFLGAALDSIYPVLNAWSTGYTQPPARGGAHAFMYYLSDMFGGLKVSGTSATGSGLELITEMVKSASIGIVNIENVTKLKIADIVGDFAAAIILDQHPTVKAASGRWTLAEPFAMTSLSGDAVKVGHRFSYDASTLSALSSDDFSSPFYTFSGFLWTQSGATKKLAFSSTQENNALTLVRVK
jgi:hypothetical protein